MFDTETKLYFLKTRYYDPKIGRFISQDAVEYLAPETVNGLNLYAYCGNNPANFVDPFGTFAITIGLIIGAIVIGGLIGGTIGGVYGAIAADSMGLNPWAGFGIGFASGFVMGAGAGVASLFIAPVLFGTATTITIGGASFGVGAAVGIGLGIAFGTGLAAGFGSELAWQGLAGKPLDYNIATLAGFQWGAINSVSAIIGSVFGPLSPANTALWTLAYGIPLGAFGAYGDLTRESYTGGKSIQNIISSMRRFYVL